MNKLQWNFNRNSNIFIQENALENVVCEMVSICLGLSVLIPGNMHLVQALFCSGISLRIANRHIGRVYPAHSNQEKKTQLQVFWALTLFPSEDTEWIFCFHVDSNQRNNYRILLTIQLSFWDWATICSNKMDGENLNYNKTWFLSDFEYKWNCVSWMKCLQSLLLKMYF